MLKQIIDANDGLPEDRVKVMFANTGREMPETLDFVHECGSRWGVPITWVEYTREGGKVGYHVVNHNSASQDGKPFEELVLSKKYLPNVAARFCTAELKIRTMKMYLVDNGWKKWTAAIGIRGDEARRINNNPSEDRWVTWYPLYHAGVNKAEVMRFWAEQPFDLKLSGTSNSTPKGNCDGCFLKSEATLAAMWKEHPDRMEWWAGIEEKMGLTFHRARTYRGMGEFVQKQQDWIFDDTAFLCQKDDGECT
jgi:3'-phosphoadenosine 5'-phosphosulfate sulfotransferase (PAPS reductase)/FAD synthetase